MTGRILVVDDEPFVCKALRKFLERKGFEVEVAHGCDEAVESYNTERPDMVLLDVRMPGKDGLETLRELRALDPKAVVIMLTAIQDMELAKRALTEGALEYINKSVNLDALELTLKSKMALIRKGIELR
jgi:DNA-binding NtrC family response regulator